MADIFDFYVYDDRSIQFTLAEPIMLEDKDVTEFRFRIPKSLNGFDMSTWAWWFVYVNAKREKFSIPLILVDDEDEPDEYFVATFSLNYGITGQVGKISFAIEVIDADTGTGEILHEWHTKTYTTSVTDTLQGNQVEYEEEAYDIISALVQQVMEQVAGQNTKIRMLNSRVDKIIALPEGSTALDAEVVDIRVGSDGTRYASAGEAVRGQVSDLKEDLNNISELNSISVTVAFEQGYRHLQTGCALTSSNSWCTSTTPVSLLKGSTISIESGYKYQLIDPTPENNGAVFASQTSEQYTAMSDVSAYIEVRNDAGTAVTPSQAQSVVTIMSNTAIVTMVNTSADILADISTRSKNLFNKNNIVNGEFVRSSDGAFVANANFWRSNFIPVTSGETYTLRYINQVAFYTAETASSFISGVGGYSTDTAATPSTFVAPSNAKYIVICGHNAQLNSDQLEIGDSFTGYAEYGYVVKQSSGESYTLISDIMSKIIFANNPVKIKLIGDSTTAGQGGTGYTNDATHGELILTDDGYGSYYTNPNGYCWANLLKSYFEEHFNCTVTNFGCSGMRVHRMVLYLDTLIADDDDIIIFMGGLNDRNDNSAHTTLQNLASDIQAIIDYCHSHNKSIIIMSPIPTLDNETGTKNFKTDDIDHVYMYAANMNGMEYISIFRKMNKYCLTSGTSLADLLNADSLHPNDTGYSIMYDLICDGLNIGVYPITAS